LFLAENPSKLRALTLHSAAFCVSNGAATRYRRSCCCTIERNGAGAGSALSVGPAGTCGDVAVVDCCVAQALSSRVAATAAESSRPRLCFVHDRVEIGIVVI